MRYLVAASVLLCLICCSVSAQILNDVREYNFIFALAGSSIERRMGDVEGTVIKGANGCDQVVIERSRLDSYSDPAYQMRVVADLTVTTVVNNTNFTTPATAVFDARLDLTGLPDNVALSVTLVPETLLVTGDLPFAIPAENTVRALSDQIARALSLSVPLGGVTRLASSNPAQTRYFINAYQQGFTYIVQIYAPSNGGNAYPPHIFRVGNVFTASINQQSVEMLLRQALRDNDFLRTFGENGFPVEGGDIRVNDVSVTLCWDSMLVTYNGVDRSGRQRTITWLMQFDRGRYGVDIMPVSVSVDGVPQALPAPEDEYINPVSQALFGVMRSTGGGMEIIVGTIGLTSITFGQIRPGVLMMAGRQW